MDVRSQSSSAQSVRTILQLVQILQLRQQTIELILDVGTQKKSLHTIKQQPQVN